MPPDSKQRFSSRVENYVKYRPGYPVDIIELLQKNYQLCPDKIIADIGAGTGISSEMFLRAGYTVRAIEPNEPMRNKSQELLGRYEKFTAVNGSAEQTGLAGQSIDAVIAGQAFHWFNGPESKKEFQRILKPGGILVLIWNERRTSSDFAKLYDELIVQHASDYVAVDHRNIDAATIRAFYQPSFCRLDVFANEQVFDFDGLKGRLLSSSYMPNENDPGYGGMLADLTSLFNRFQQDGKIVIEYDTNVYSGVL